MIASADDHHGQALARHPACEPVSLTGLSRVALERNVSGDSHRIGGNALASSPLIIASVRAAVPPAEWG